MFVWFVQVGEHSVGALSCKITPLIDYKSNFGGIEIHQENNSTTSLSIINKI